MWNDVRWRSAAGLCLLVTAAGGLAACAGDSGAPEVAEAETSVAANADPAAASAPADAPETIADLFPEGPAKQLVLTNCASCHAVACSVIGQRTAARWDNLMAAHRERLPGLSEEELQTTFAYLSANFSEDQPEPFVPAEFLQRGCTPF